MIKEAKSLLAWRILLFSNLRSYKSDSIISIYFTTYFVYKGLEIIHELLFQI